MVFRLLLAGYQNTTGIDYSHPSIDLARAIAKRRELGEDEDTFKVLDILKDDGGKVENQFKIICDKGTYDAISLSDEILDDGSPLIKAYPAKVANLLQRGGVFLITSCWFYTSEFALHDYR